MRTDIAGLPAIQAQQSVQRARKGGEESSEESAFGRQIFEEIWLQQTSATEMQFTSFPRLFPRPPCFERQLAFWRLPDINQVLVAMS